MEDNETIKAELEVFKESPLAESYLAIIKQIDNWNVQLQDKDIDLFGESGQKEFDRAFKYFAELPTIIETLAFLRKEMNPKQEEKVTNESKALKWANKYKEKK